METSEIIRQQIEDSIDVKKAMLESPKVISSIEEAVDICVSAYRNGNKVMWCGATEAQSYASELVVKSRFDRPGLPSIALGSEPSISHQVSAQGVVGDVLVCLSGESNVKALSEAMEAAWQKHISVVTVTGSYAGKLDKADVVIKVPSSDEHRVKEGQQLVAHILCSLVEKTLFPSFDPEN